MNCFQTQTGRLPLVYWLLMLMTLPIVGRSQSTGFLQLTSIQVVPGNPIEFTFVDAGTGATNYQVEFTTIMEAAPIWIELPDAVISPLGNGVFHVMVQNPGAETGFFRVRGLGGSIPTVTASFNSTALEVTEGGIVAPVIQFSSPYYGTIRYTISGTAASGDYQSLSGQVTVAGTSATIPITFADNLMIGQLKHLTLTLEAGPGILLGSGSETIITITENDAAWQGSFMAGNSLVGFVMNLNQSNGSYTASLRGQLPGLFPTGGVPVSLQWSANEFVATAVNIPVPPESTLLGLPIQLTLQLQAANGVPNQSVGPTQIEGSGLLISSVPDKPFLNTTNVGTFLLLRPPAAPSTNEIDFVNLN